MTHHVSEDTLLKLALGLLTIRSESRARNHLRVCPGCCGLMENIDRSLRQIKDVSPEVTADIPPIPSSGYGRYKWLRVAAMLAVGFGLGYLAAESTRPPSIVVVRQQIVPTPPESPVAGFVVCDEVDVSRRLRSGNHGP